ncbi:hypothetical protein [Mucilaginibacter auburnensis]|uniref:Uncharacterized protein n=1 Tax=Mucilaginibacter auburnensis TaxID=1457233 RepID=A0A2H9VMQ0_9SPHI|nr:hypothetical protein [Mucilaginibacter auburnensis]PJJ79595.1 hypothetical protein CLV57_2729 [Mucilaginibacter auburnensis]
MKACIAIILLFFTVTVNAQNIDASASASTAFDNYVWNCALGEDSEYANISIGTNIFGDQVKTYSKPSGGVLLSVKRSKNIFGDKVTTVTNRQGLTLLELQKTKDIFGAETVKITGTNGQLLGSITRSVDIFGAKKTEIRDVAHNTTTVITASTDIFNNRQINISGPKNSYENMLAGFVAEMKY